MGTKLSKTQLAEFEKEGYLFLESVFDPGEVKLLLDQAHEIFALEREEVVREKDGASARTAFAVQHYNEAYRRLARHPRLVDPVKQILGGDVYMHQCKINAKVAFNGDVWQWHQDYGTWARDDLMPGPHAMNIALFLDDVTAVNGPLMFIPRSHRKGMIDAGHDVETTSYPLWTIDNDLLAELAEDGGVVAPTGTAGSLVMFHGNLVHASPANMSPYDRTIVYLSLCRTDNHIRQFKRPAWIAERDFTPIKCLPENCLQELVESPERRAA